MKTRRITVRITQREWEELRALCSITGLDKTSEMVRLLIKNQVNLFAKTHSIK